MKTDIELKTNFKELKAELLLKAKNNNACKSGYFQAEKCETEKELIQVIAENFKWIWKTNTMTIEDLNKFDSELLQSVGIFANYEGNINSDLDKLIIVDSSAPRIETYNSSAPRIETYNSSAPTIITYNSSAPIISGMKNCIIAVNLSLILDLDNSIIYKSDIWSVK